MSDRKKAIDGVFWLGLNRGISFFAAFVSGVILARILDPADFGIVALGTAVAMIFNRLSTIGLSPELMRIKDRDPDYQKILSTYFWINAALVIVVFIVGVGGVWISSFLEQRTFLIFIIVFAGWSLNSLLGVGRILLYQRMQFKVVAFLDFIPAIFAAILGIVMAVLGYGLWSLVIPQLLFMILATLVAFQLAGFKPLVCFKKDAAVRLVKRSPWYLTNSIAVEGFQRIDDIILGKLAGDIALGFYQRAYYMSSIFHKNIGTVFNRTLIPFLFHHVENEDRMQKMYAYAVKLIFYVIGAALCVLLVYCAEIIELLFTDKWLPCVPIFYTVAIYVIMLPLFHVNKEFAIAQDDVPRIGRISLENVVILVVLLFPCVKWGSSVGAALAVDLAMGFGLTRVIFLVRKKCPIKFSDVYLRPILICAVGFFLAFFLKGIFRHAAGEIGGIVLNLLFILGWFGGALVLFEKKLLGLFFPRMA